MEELYLLVDPRYGMILNGKVHKWIISGASLNYATHSLNLWFESL